MLSKTLRQRCSAAALVVILALGLTLGSSRPAQALTIMLEFVTAPTTDIFGVQTNTANFAPFGFTGLTTLQIQAAMLASVNADYLGYPTVGADPQSPLPNGMELNINFEIGAGAPSSGDPDFYRVAIGNDMGTNTFLGQACLSCVRGGTLAPAGARVGSILVDNIAGLAFLATTDAQRINLLGGTTAHEIGHPMSLVHPNGQVANPGASLFDIMATGAPPTNMPDNQRILDRAFSYADFGILINQIGLRQVGQVPEPGMLPLLALGLFLVSLSALRRRRAL